MRNQIKKVYVLAALALCASVGVSQAQNLEGTLKKIKETGTITIGHRESSIPFSYLDAKQKPIGYSMDLCAKVVAAVKAELKLPNLEVKYVPVTSQNRIPLVEGGTVDLECGSTTNTSARQKQVSFGVTTYVANVKTLVKANSGIKDIDDLNGKPVVTTQGTTSDQLIKKHEKGAKIDLKNTYAKDHADSFLMVKTDRAVAFVMDDILLAGLIANSDSPKDYSIVGSSLRQEPYGMIIRKDDPTFKALVDNALKAVMKSGEITKIYAKWFTSPIAPKNINLNFPMSAELKAIIANPNDNPAKD
jgi:glutamate/aspartate transport system substrate-binding protein